MPVFNKPFQLSLGLRISDKSHTKDFRRRRTLLCSIFQPTAAS